MEIRWDGQIDGPNMIDRPTFRNKGHTTNWIEIE